MFFQQILAWINSLSPDVMTKAVRVALTAALGLLLVRLIAAFTAAVNDPEVVANFTKGGGEPRNLSGDAFAARVKREIDDLRELNKSLKLTLE